MRNWTLDVRDIPDPVPGSGQVLVRTRACGICGSDLHMLKHGAAMAALGEELRKHAPPEPIETVRMESDRDVVMGHEFCGEVVDLGPDCTNLKTGDLVVSIPVAFDGAGLHTIGYSNNYPGGYAELMVLSDLAAMKVPNGLDYRNAALTEPLAVGIHAVAKSKIALRRRRRRARMRPCRPRCHRRPRETRHRADRRVGLLPCPARTRSARWARTRSWTRATSARSTRGGGSTVRSRS